MRLEIKEKEQTEILQEQVDKNASMGLYGEGLDVMNKESRLNLIFF